MIMMVNLIFYGAVTNLQALCFQNHLPPVSTLATSSLSIFGSYPVVIKGWLENRTATEHHYERWYHSKNKRNKGPCF